VAAVWTCPVCQRKVPDRVEECYCGVRRDQALQHAHSQEVKARAGRANPWPIAAVVIAVAVSAAVVLRNPPPPRETPAPAATPVAVIATSPPAPTSAPRAATLPPAPPPPLRAAVGEERVAEPSPPPPSPSPSAEVASPVDGARTRGTAAFESAAAALARQTDELSSRVRSYSAQCGQSMPQFDRTIGCDTERHTLETELARIARALDEADDAARQAWVEPGSRRQIRDRRQIDDRLAELKRQMADAFGPRP
jgi:hypothetical protein